MLNGIGKLVNGSVIYDYQCSDARNCTWIDITVGSGFWKLELWGASGGDGFNKAINFTHAGGRGGYSVGVIKFERETNLSLFIGGAGISNQTNKTPGIVYGGGYNGGGNGFVGSLLYPTGSGGGSTDIRLGGTSLENRIIVAGGGGGAGPANCNKAIGSFGGHGGGIKGINGGGYCAFFSGDSGSGGTQTEGGKPGKGNEIPGQNGTLLNGGDSGTNTASSGGGGGGGYFGGGGGSAGGGGGGSGYIGNMINAFGVKAQTTNGAIDFPSPFGGIQKGHTGNGVIRITYLDPSSFKTCHRRHYHQQISHVTLILLVFSK